MYIDAHTETMTMITRPNVQSVAIQCDLLAAPPLFKLPPKKDEGPIPTIRSAPIYEVMKPVEEEESLPSEAELNDIDGHLDTSYHISQDEATTE